MAGGIPAVQVTMPVPTDTPLQRAQKIVAALLNIEAGANSLIQTAVTGNVPPTAAFTYSYPDTMTVSVNGGTSTDSDGTVVSWSWAFGDGGSGAGSATTYTYTAPGTYVVTLTVTDNAGATAQASHAVTVSLPPTTPYTNDPGTGAFSGAEPSGAGYIPFESLSGNLQQRVNSVAAPNLLALPPSTIATLNGFTSTMNSCGLLSKTCAGIVGAGSAKTTIEQTASTSAGATAPGGGTNAHDLMRFEQPGVILQDFQIVGTAQQVPYYNGIRIKASNPTVTRVKLVNAGPGNDKAPPGETFGLNLFSGSGGVITDVEVDGQGKGASGFATNSWAGTLQVTRLYTHDNWYSGGIALWQTIGNVTFDDCTFDKCRCFWNIERCGGTVTLNRPRIGSLKTAGAPAVGIFTETGNVYTTAAQAQGFRFVVNDPRNLDGTPYSGPKIVVQFGTAYDDSNPPQKIPQLYGRSNFKAYDASGTDISSSFFTYTGSYAN
jgi:PKD repeat protein